MHWQVSRDYFTTKPVQHSRRRLNPKFLRKSFKDNSSNITPGSNADHAIQSQIYHGKIFQDNYNVEEKKNDTNSEAKSNISGSSTGYHIFQLICFGLASCWFPITICGEHIQNKYLGNRGIFVDQNFRLLCIYMFALFFLWVFYAVLLFEAFVVHSRIYPSRM